MNNEKYRDEMECGVNVATGQLINREKEKEIVVDLTIY